MASLFRCIRLVAIASAVAVTCQVDPVIAEERPLCTEDAMLVFDASGSMSINAAARIMASVQSLVPAGGTPLTRAVEQGAEVLDFRSKPGVIVVLTDGEDTCGGSPCRVGKELHAAAMQLTIRVISLRVKGLSWRAEGRIVEAQCLADYNGGLYLTPETTDDLIAALEKTLGCPMVSRHSPD